MDEFIRKYVIRDEKSVTAQEVMYEGYLIYCESERIKPRSKIWFGREMKMFGYGATLNSKGEREHVGMRLIECKY